MPNSDLTSALPAAPARPFERVSYSRQFLLVSSALLLLGMAVVGGWLSLEIERSAVNRAAAIAGVYVESILVAQLHPTPEGITLQAGTHEAFDQIFRDGPLRRKVVRFKLWDPQGTLLYSTAPAQLGRRQPIDKHLAVALAGSVQAHITDLDDAGHEDERERWSHLLEVYVPVRANARSPVVAVAEFYHATENLDRDIRSAQRRSWTLVVVTTLAIFLLLFMQVRRANDTIVQQRDDLHRQLQQLRAAFEENERMRKRLGEAGAATTTLNEQFLHRIAADLHDAPAQTLAFALMRIDELAGCGDVTPELQAIRAALRSSLADLRNIAAGLGVPGIADLPAAETARRAVRDFERRSGIKVDAEIDDSLQDAGMAAKITLYRLLQESLTNSGKHAPGSQPRVRVWRDDGQMRIEVGDTG
ncbi:MAG TPA: histidine kinase, partial [Azonexus sp.]